MPKRNRCVPQSFPVVLFACLLLTTCARAQNDVFLGVPDASASVRIIQILLDQQQVPLASTTPCTTNLHSKQVVDTYLTRAWLHSLLVSKADPGSPAQFVSEVETWPRSPRLSPLPTPTLQRQVTPGQFFGNGTQAAP